MPRHSAAALFVAAAFLVLVDASHLRVGHKWRAAAYSSLSSLLFIDEGAAVLEAPSELSAVRFLCSLYCVVRIYLQPCVLFVVHNLTSFSPSVLGPKRVRSLALSAPSPSLWLY